MKLFLGSQVIVSDFTSIILELANVVKFVEYSVFPLYPIREFVLLTGCSTGSSTQHMLYECMVGACRTH